MGARCLFRVLLEGKTASEIRDELIRRVEMQHGHRLPGNWNALVAGFTVGTHGETVHIISLPRDAAATRFAVAGSPNLPTMMAMDQQYQEILLGMSRYRQRSHRSAHGVDFDFPGDFIVRVGAINGEIRRVAAVVDIEYRPCSVTEECESMIEELMETLAAPLPAFESRGGEAAVARLNWSRVTFDFSIIMEDEDASIFSPRHLALLYKTLLS